MSTQTVFYDSTTKEILYTVMGDAPQAQKDAEAGNGRSWVNATSSDVIPTNHYYINADETGIIKKSEFSISVSPSDGIRAVDETFTLTGVPEGTKVYANSSLLTTMNSDSSLVLTATQAGIWRLIFEKDNYFQGEMSLQVKRRGE
jgi:hypothetical protein